MTKQKQSDVYAGLEALLQELRAQKALLYALIDTHPNPEALMERYNGYAPTAFQEVGDGPPDVQERMKKFLLEWHTAIHRQCHMNDPAGHS